MQTNPTYHALPAAILQRFRVIRGRLYVVYVECN